MQRVKQCGSAVVTVPHEHSLSLFRLLDPRLFRPESFQKTAVLVSDPTSCCPSSQPLFANVSDSVVQRTLSLMSQQGRVDASIAHQLLNAFQRIDLSWAAIKRAAAKLPESGGAASSAQMQTCVHRVCPSDLRTSMQPETQSAKHSFFTSSDCNCIAGVSTPLVPDRWQQHQQSLTGLLHLDEYLSGEADDHPLDGIFAGTLSLTSSGASIIPLCEEQLGMQSTITQLMGDTILLVLDQGQEGPIKEMVKKLCALVAAAKGAAAAEEAVTLIRFYAQGLMVTPSLLDEHHVTFHFAALQNMVTYTGYGPLCGVSFGGGRMGSNLASKQLPFSWLQSSGVKHIIELLQWVSQLASNEALADNMSACQITPGQLAQALHQCPHQLTCALLRALKEAASNSSLPQSGSAEDEDQGSVGEQCEAGLAILRMPCVIALYKNHYVGKLRGAEAAVCDHCENLAREPGLQ